jgi:hypothetical protein
LFCRSTVSALSPVRNEFQVIDWAGSRPDGFPGIDALRFSLSAFGQGRLASRWLGSYCAATGLTKPEFALHCVCAMGQLGTNLDQFPKQRFDALTASLLGFLERHDFLDLR